jgi:hypothetical protein
MVTLGGRAVSDGRYTHAQILVHIFGTPNSVVEDEEMAPLPTALKPVVVSKLGMNSGGEALLNKEDHCGGGEESDTSSEDDTGYTSPCNEEAKSGGEEATDEDNKSIKSINQWSWRIFVPVYTVGRKGINHPMPLVSGSSQGGNVLVVGFNLLIGLSFWKGKILGRLGVDK